ncbi:hypothetical protein ACFWFZ_11325 [Streptomyces sp. NPDC060232]
MTSILMSCGERAEEPLDDLPEDFGCEVVVGAQEDLEEVGAADDALERLR